MMHKTSQCQVRFEYCRADWFSPPLNNTYVFML